MEESGLSWPCAAGLIGRHIYKVRDCSVFTEGDACQDVCVLSAFGYLSLQFQPH